ncbi:MAG: DUF3139 domain-containing protein [Bacillota bacterium]|nr:DUF3139 domain-containing protein [Bacillota bacterium]
MKKSIYLILIVIVALGGMYFYKFPITKHEVLNQVKTYLNKREDAFLLNSEVSIYNFKIGAYLVNVTYKDEPNILYTYAFDKGQHKVYLYKMIKYKNGTSAETQIGKHDSMYFKDQQDN